MDDLSLDLFLDPLDQKVSNQNSGIRSVNRRKQKKVDGSKNSDLVPTDY